MTDNQVKEVTAQIKKLADVRPQSIEDVDMLLKQYHRRASIDEGVQDDVWWVALRREIELLSAHIYWSKYLNKS